MGWCSRPTTPTAPSSRSMLRTVGWQASFRLGTRRRTWPLGTGSSGFRYRARALCDRGRDRDLAGDDLGPDVLDLGLERAGHPRADRAEADTARPEGEAGSATGLERPARELLDRVEHGHVQPLHRARQYVLAEMGLVDIDSDPPDPTLACRLQRPEAAGPGDLEHDSRSLRDLAQSDRPTFRGVEEVVGVAVQRRDTRIGSSRACLVAGDPALDRRHPLAADRADHLLPGREPQHERSQVTGQITGLLFPKHEAHYVLRAMRQIIVGDVDDREPRFGKPGGDFVDRGGGSASCGNDSCSDDEVVLLPREKREARDVAFLRGGCQHSPSDPQLSDGPLEAEVGHVAIRVVDASRLYDESDSEAPFAHQTRLILSDARWLRIAGPTAVSRDRVTSRSVVWVRVGRNLVPADAALILDGRSTVRRDPPGGPAGPSGLSSHLISDEMSPCARG